MRIPSKLLIITADDYGLHPLVNEAIRQLFRNKRISQTSVLINGPEIAAELEKLLSVTSPSSIGLHFNLTEGFSFGKSYQTLTQPIGKFYPKQEFYSRWEKNEIDLEEIKQECFLQIKKIRQYIPEVTHFDSHNHIHLYPEIFQALLPLLITHQFKTIRIPNEPLEKNRYAQQSQQILHANASLPLLCCPAFFGLAWVGKPNFPGLEMLRFFLKESPCCALEWMTHPGFHFLEKENTHYYGTSTLTPPLRQLEFDFLNSPELAQFFQSYTFQIGTYLDWWSEYCDT